MKIIFVNTLYSPYKVGGAEKSVQSICENLALNGHKLGIITIGETSENIQLNSVSVFRIKIQNKYWPFGSFRPNGFQKLIWHFNDIYNKKYDSELKAIFDKFDPDVVHTNNLTGISVRIWDLANQKNIPIVHTLRDYYLMSPSTTDLNLGLKDKLYSFIKKKASQRVQMVCGISKSILENHQKSGYFKNVYSQVIYNGFQIEKKQLVHNKENKSAENLHFGFLGQVEEHKGIFLLLEVFQQIKNQKISLNIAGKVSDEIKNTYKNDQRISFLGYVDTHDFLKKIDILVVPSLWNEPFGRVVLEGILKGKVVLGSRIGAIPELLENNQDFLFEPNLKSLKSKLEYILDNPTFIQNFKFDDSFLKKFELKNTVKEYENIYSQLNHP